MKPVLKIALPKGRLNKNTYNFLREKGYNIPDESREYWIQLGDVSFFLAKPRSIPALVWMGAVDAGFVGRDIVMDYENKLDILMDTGLNPVKMIMSTLPEFNPRKIWLVATEFPNYVSALLTERKQSHYIIPTGGSTEGYVSGKIADVCVDVCETGETIRSNGLAIREVLFESTTVLCACRPNNELAKFVESLK